MALNFILSSGGNSEGCDTGLVNVVTLGCHRAVVSWKIENAGVAFQDSTLVSPSFDCFDSCWFMDLEKKNKYSPTVDLKLQKITGKVSNVFLRIYLDYSHREIIEKYSDVRLFPFDETSEQHVATFFRTETTGPNYFHPTDFLHFALELELEEHNTKPLDCNDISPASAGTELLARDILELFTEHKNCDVTLRADGKEFPAHRLILGARSSVLEGMLESDTEEESSGFMNIKDVSSDTLYNLLIYIYSGDMRVSNVEETGNLYLAAEQFELIELKERCANALIAELSIENAFDLAMFGDANSDEKIIDSVKMYVCEHLSLLSTSDWTDFMRKRPSLASDMLLWASLELTRRAGIVPEHFSEK